MGGVDKGLQTFRGRRLVDHVYERLAPQVGGIIINANQNQEEYRTFGVRVVTDRIVDSAARRSPVLEAVLNGSQSVLC
jgi:molybdenum cofactor guanylyltransferase